MYQSAEVTRAVPSQLCEAPTVEFVLKEEVGTLPRFFYYFDERYPNQLDPDAVAIAERLREEEGDAYGALPGVNGPSAAALALASPQRCHGARA